MSSGQLPLVWNGSLIWCLQYKNFASLIYNESLDLTVFHDVASQFPGTIIVKKIYMYSDINIKNGSSTFKMVMIY